MMDYNSFKKEVEDKFMGYMPEEMQGMELYIRKAGKVNAVLDAVSVIRKGGGMSASPTVYVNDMYGHYIKYGSLEGTLRQAASCLLRAMEDGQAVIDKFDMKAAGDNIVFQVINTGQNRGMLADMPSRPFLDLSVIYRWVVHMDGGAVHSTMVNNSLAGRLGLTEGQMFSLAAENTMRLFPPTAKPMEDALWEFEASFPKGTAKRRTADGPAGIEMWLLTNSSGFNGAASMLYGDVLHALAEKLGEDLYILPSSVHEVIAVPAAPHNADGLADMVAEINMSSVAPEERLSNQVYHYDRTLRRLTLATDTPNKRL